MKRKVDQPSFFDHMDELRERLFKSCLTVVLFSIVAYQYKEHLLAYIIRPVGKLVFTSPAEAFVLQITLSIFAGFLLSLPIVAYQLWQFVGCALREEERRFIYTFGPASLVLFVLGTVFAYYFLIPFSMNFLLSYSSELLVPMITVKSYLSFVVTMVFSFGILFEFPLVILFLTKIGIATPAFLVQKRRHAIVLIFIIAAVVTPPDAFTQLMMAVPLMVLYELSIIAAKVVYKRDFVYKSSL